MKRALFLAEHFYIFNSTLPVLWNFSWHILKKSEWGKDYVKTMIFNHKSKFEEVEQLSISASTSSQLKLGKTVWNFFIHTCKMNLGNLYFSFVGIKIFKSVEAMIEILTRRTWANLSNSKPSRRIDSVSLYWKPFTLISQKYLRRRFQSFIAIRW